MRQSSLRQGLIYMSYRSVAVELEDRSSALLKMSVPHRSRQGLLLALVEGWDSQMSFSYERALRMAVPQ